MRFLYHCRDCDYKATFEVSLEELEKMSNDPSLLKKLILFVKRTKHTDGHDNIGVRAV